MLLVRRTVQQAYASALSTFVLLLPAIAYAAGSDLGGTADVPLAGGTNIRPTILKILNTVLSFLALLAVIFIIVAGIRLIVSQGEDDQKDKAKKTIIYVAVGLIVVLIAKVIVTYVIDTFK
ncbi:MAG: conserved membrane protein of unknown function [Candidatus Peregrinibacteria bacterium Greene0416_19]|nr:MAG: conserved membrane protein of unknown function [Candidatus Peregrinibacteria bacterium Greene0416_19]